MTKSPNPYFSVNEVYTKLSNLLNREPSPRIWDYMIKHGYIDDAISEHEDIIEDILVIYRELEELQKDKNKPQQTVREVPPDQRGIALSKILSIEAANDQQVKKFRESYLNNTLLTWDEAVSWIKQEKEKEGKPTTFVKIPIPSTLNITLDGEPFEWLKKLAETPLNERRTWPLNMEVKILDYLIPGDQWVHRFPVAFGGALDELRLLSENLSKRYGWPAAAATIFVLSGIPYMLPKARITTSINSYYPALSKITVQASPAVPVNEIMDIYTAARKKILGPGKRDRAVTQQWRAELAVFVAEHNDGRSWRKAMELWNQQHPVKPKAKRMPGQGYEHPSIFARDGRQAYEKITGKHLLWGKEKNSENNYSDSSFKQLKNIYT
ncbi:MAG: hypothetical protein KGZ63_14685 [Clostridiales bacterium]|jgi:hypothetical protein|nr:hypothetical protein [Clostridiales bacterium]